MRADVTAPVAPRLARVLPWCDPLAAFAGFEAEPQALLLHDGQSGRARIFARPDESVTGTDAADYERFGERFRARGEGLWAGLLGYDLAGAFERLPRFAPDWPAIAMAHYPVWAEMDRASSELRVYGADDGLVDDFVGTLQRAYMARPTPGQPATWSAAWRRDAYLGAAQRARDYVHAGDVFQVNLSQKFAAELADDDTPYAVFERLCAASPAPHAAYLRLGVDEVILTNSPERFLSVKNGLVESRPIKGTRPRMTDAELDRKMRADLLASRKDRAENLMIVDLMRNDLSRVCQPGSVEVPRLCEIESFANVHHLVSDVTGRLREDCDLVDLLRASFPPGSITGAPKVRAMEIIAELEAEPRGPYCGALGWMTPNGDMDLNVMIRTASLRRSGRGWQAEIRSGGGIVADSDPVSEYEETLAKASALKAALGAREC